MREKLFRGKRVDNDEWVYGDLQHNEIGDTWISRLTSDLNGRGGLFENVKNKTIGQMILSQPVGESGKIGSLKWFEGEIVDFWIIGDEENKQRTVIGEFGKIHGEFGDFETWTLEWAMDADYQFESVGNIHDNPELIK